MQQPQQPAKILRWREEAEARIAYLAQQEKQALIDIDALPVGSHIRAAHWAYIKEMGYRKNELQDLLKKFPAEDLSAPASPVEERLEEFEQWVKENTPSVDTGLDATDYANEVGFQRGWKRGSVDAYRHLTESKPSPVIETRTGSLDEWAAQHDEWCKEYGLGPYEKQQQDKPDPFLVWLDEQSNEQEKLMDKENNNIEPYQAYYGAWNMLDQVVEKYLSLYGKASHPAPALISSSDDFTKWVFDECANLSYEGESLKSIERFKQGAFAAHRKLNEAKAHPAPSLIVGEREEEAKEYRNVLIDLFDGLDYEQKGLAAKVLDKYHPRNQSHTAPTEQALPDWAEEQLEADKDIIRDLESQLAEVKETLRVSSQNETIYRVWLEKSKKALASARTLITKIKRWDVYQEPADECDKWLRENPEIGKEGEK